MKHEKMVHVVYAFDLAAAKIYAAKIRAAGDICRVIDAAKFCSEKETCDFATLLDGGGASRLSAELRALYGSAFTRPVSGDEAPAFVEPKKPRGRPKAEPVYFDQPPETIAE